MCSVEDRIIGSNRIIYISAMLYFFERELRRQDAVLKRTLRSSLFVSEAKPVWMILCSVSIWFVLNCRCLGNEYFIVLLIG